MQKRTNFSSIATSIEQSKRLLEAGLDPKSADMRWEQFPGLVPRLCYQPNAMPLIAPKVIPAWSLSKLIEILDHDIYIGYDDLFDGLVNDVLYIISHGEIKQEYLKRNDNRNATENE